MFWATPIGNADGNRPANPAIVARRFVQGDRHLRFEAAGRLRKCAHHRVLQGFLNFFTLAPVGPAH
jgi:hypothetical protein